MKNKYLTAWVILLLLLGASCKKQENLHDEKLNQRIEKTDLVGAWVPIKIETTGLTKDGVMTVVDSSDNIKSYIPGLFFTNDEMNMGSVKGKYSIHFLDEKSFLSIGLRGKIQDYEILRKQNFIKLKLQESNSQSITFHFIRKTQ